MAGRQSKDQKETAQAVQEKVGAEGHVTGQRPDATTMVGEVVGRSGHVAPGDAPADTSDPTERVSTTIPSGAELAEAVQRGEGAVVATTLLPERKVEDEDSGESRTERYEVVVNALTDERVTVERNMDTGESRRV